MRQDQLEDFNSLEFKLTDSIMVGTDLRLISKRMIFLVSYGIAPDDLLFAFKTLF